MLTCFPLTGSCWSQPCNCQHQGQKASVSPDPPAAEGEKTAEPLKLGEIFSVPSELALRWGRCKSHARTHQWRWLEGAPHQPLERDHVDNGGCRDIRVFWGEDEVFCRAERIKLAREKGERDCLCGVPDSGSKALELLYRRRNGSPDR